jgi:hypothetical protein
MIAYDSDLFDPPAPLAHVEVRGLNRETTLAAIPMLLDSGADVTLVPKFCADSLDIKVADDQTYD